MSDQSNATKILDELIAQFNEEIDREDGAYEPLLHTLHEVSTKGGVLIDKGTAEKLVRRHLCMPPNFGKNLDKKILKKHFETTVNNAEWGAISIDVLRSVEAFTRVEKIAEFDPTHFDALLRAATIVLDPTRNNEDFPTKKYIFRWFSDVGNRRITRPTRHRRGSDPSKNTMRDLILLTIVQDLMWCGLPKLRNDATNAATPSACAVVAEVCGLSINTVRTAVNRVEKALSEIGENAVHAPLLVLWQKLILHRSKN